MTTSEIGPCEYCLDNAPIFIGPPEAPEKSFVCRQCLKLLRNKSTAIPLIRGNLTMKLRGIVPEEKLKKTIDTYMEKLLILQPHAEKTKSRN